MERIKTPSRRVVAYGILGALPVLLWAIVHLGPDKPHSTEIGHQPSLQMGYRNSIAALSRALLEFGDQRELVVHWEFGEAKPMETHYQRGEQEIWYGPPESRNTVTSGYHWHSVTPEAIHAVARKRGVFKDLKSYGANDV